MKRPMLFVHLAGGALSLALLFGFTARAHAFYPQCSPNEVVCSPGCEPVMHWDYPMPCCTQEAGTCCVRVCYNYHCDGIGCAYINEGMSIPSGDLTPGNCYVNPSCAYGA